MEGVERSRTERVGATSLFSPPSPRCYYYYYYFSASNSSLRKANGPLPFAAEDNPVGTRSSRRHCMKLEVLTRKNRHRRDAAKALFPVFLFSIVEVRTGGLSVGHASCLDLARPGSLASLPGRAPT